MAAGRKTGGGSRLGKPNRVTKALKEMILGALDAAGGETYLTTQATKNPTAFMALLGRVLPTTLAGDPNAPLQIINRIEMVPVEPRKHDGAD